MSIPTPTFKLVIATPLFNDWESFDVLIQNLVSMAKLNSLELEIIAIDDGSTQSYPDLKPPPNTKIQIIHLARNLGHQKAIALGLAYIAENNPCDAVIVMDSDGEDNPADIPALLASQRANPDRIVFAGRARRSEGAAFKLFYFFYKVIFRLLTGKQIAFGNFSLIPASLLQRVTHLPEIWNHYAAGLMRANLPWDSIPTQRAKRYRGQSKMNFVSLILHGLSAMSVYIEVLTIRLMIAVSAIIMLGVVGFGVMLYYRFFTPLAIPGWATNVAIGLTIIVSQAMLFLLMLTFLVLNYRSNKLFIPAKDYHDYFLSIESLQ